MSRKTDKELFIIGDIRQAIGCGDEPMLSKLPAIIKQMRALALVIYAMHEEEKKLLAGLSKPEKCMCAECEFLRKYLGAK